MNFSSSHMAKEEMNSNPVKTTDKLEYGFFMLQCSKLGAQRQGARLTPTDNGAKLNVITPHRNTNA